jgi:hypothetical protein
MLSTKDYAAHSAHEPLKPFSFDRREPTPTDVQIEILFAGSATLKNNLSVASSSFGFLCPTFDGF